MFAIQLESIQNISKKNKQLLSQLSPQPQHRPQLPMFSILHVTSNVNMHFVQQFSERVDRNKINPLKRRGLSQSSASHKEKRHTQQCESHLLELPISLRIDNDMAGKRVSNSHLLRGKVQLPEEARKFPRIPKKSTLQQVIIEAKLQHSKQKVRTRQIEQPQVKLMVESKAIELKTHNQEQLDTMSPKVIQRNIFKPPLPARSLLPIYRSCVSKRSTKKELTDIMDTRDSLTKPEELVPKPPKYKKGYLFYDSNCLSHYKSRGEIPLTQVSVPQRRPQISAQDYCVLDLYTLQMIHIHKTNKGPTEIASLTKIVTCLLCILACKKYQVDMSSFRCRISEEASAMVGTSAELQAGDILNIEELLYGLMLPSGNDAAVALAQIVGRIIQRKKKIQNNLTPLQTFVKQMNVIYREVVSSQQEKIHVFKNPSGLTQNPNTTSLEQVSLFAAVACKNDYFSRIVNTRSYSVTVNNERYGISRKVQWNNTNRLLSNGWAGVKTGTTENAGHCFIGRFDHYMFTLLDCKSLEARFLDAQVLKNWLMSHDQPQEVSSLIH